MGRREVGLPGPPYTCPWCSSSFRDWDLCLRHLSGSEVECSDRARRFMMEELRKQCLVAKQDQAPEWEDFDGVKSDASEQVLSTAWAEPRTGCTETASTSPSQPDELTPDGEVTTEMAPRVVPFTILQRPQLAEIPSYPGPGPAAAAPVMSTAERLVGRWHGKDHSGKRWQWHEVYWLGQRLRCTTWTAGVSPQKGLSRNLYVLEEGQKVVWGKGEIILDSVQLASDSRVVWLNPDPKKLDWHWFPGWPF